MPVKRNQPRRESEQGQKSCHCEESLEWVHSSGLLPVRSAATARELYQLCACGKTVIGVEDRVYSTGKKIFSQSQ